MVQAGLDRQRMLSQKEEEVFLVDCTEGMVIYLIFINNYSINKYLIIKMKLKILELIVSEATHCNRLSKHYV